MTRTTTWLTEAVADLGDQGKIVREDTPFGTVIVWQDVPRGQTGGVLVGDIPETILPLVIARLRAINNGNLETSAAIKLCENALLVLEARREDRDARGVTGTEAP